VTLGLAWFMLGRVLSRLVMLAPIRRGQGRRDPRAAPWGRGARRPNQRPTSRAIDRAVV